MILNDLRKEILHVDNGNALILVSLLQSFEIYSGPQPSIRPCTTFLYSPHYVALVCVPCNQPHQCRD